VQPGIAALAAADVDDVSVGVCDQPREEGFIAVPELRDAHAALSVPGGAPGNHGRRIPAATADLTLGNCPCARA
jgi:hypothetical protein